MLRSIDLQEIAVDEYVERIVESGESVVIIYKDRARKVYGIGVEKRLKGGLGFDREAYILEKYKSPYFVRLLSYTDKEIVMEKCGKSVRYGVENKERLVEWLKGLKDEFDRLGVAVDGIGISNILHCGDTYKLVDFTHTREKGHHLYEQVRQQSCKEIDQLIKDYEE